MGSVAGLRKAFASRFTDEMQFFKGWLHQPKAVGAVLPTSSTTARKMASLIDTARSGLPVLELGPGTGVITKAILAHGVDPQKLYSVEYSPEFAAYLRRRFPGVNVIEGDAFNLDEALGGIRDAKFDTVISGVPLLNFPVSQRVRYLEHLLDRLPEGRPVVQLTYGPKSPIPAGRGSYTVEHFRFVLRNFPPTQLWVYRRRRPN